MATSNARRGVMTEERPRPPREGRATVQPLPPALPVEETAPVEETGLTYVYPLEGSSLTAASENPEELAGMEELGPQLNWVSLDAPRGLLVCKNLGLEVSELFGTIRESRVVRVMKDGDGMVFCASSDRLVADVGRPGRVCQECEDRSGPCFARWWIAWEEKPSGLIFAHTLSQTGTLNFTRYVGSLKREGLLPSEVETRLFVEVALRRKTMAPYRRLQFEKSDPFN